MPTKRNNNKKQQQRPKRKNVPNSRPANRANQLRNMRARKVVPDGARVSIPRRIVPRDPLYNTRNLVALVDPFCQSAKGVKWPDGLGEASMTYQTRTLANMGAFANGTALAYFTADAFFNNLAATANPFTMNSVWSAATTGSLATYAAATRTVTAGIIIRNILPALTAQGYVIVTRQSKAAVLSGTVTPGQEFGTDVQVFPICAGLEIPIVFRPLSVTARSFVVPSTNTVLLGGLSWDFIKVEIVGGAASVTNLVVECVNNLEFTLPDSQEQLTQLSPVSAPFSRALCDASDAVSIKVQRVPQNSLTNFAKFAITEAATAAGGAYGGPAGAAVGAAGGSALAEYLFDN
jgi:hypothetical protein